jgi:hypothetical protein
MLLSHMQLIAVGMTTIESFSMRSQLDRERAFLTRQFGVCGWTRKRKAMKTWGREWGDLKDEGNRWFLGPGPYDEWKRVMGDSPVGWIREQHLSSRLLRLDLKLIEHLPPLYSSRRSVQGGRYTFPSEPAFRTGWDKAETARLAARAAVTGIIRLNRTAGAHRRSLLVSGCIDHSYHNLKHLITQCIS